MNFGLLETWMALPNGLAWALGVGPVVPLLGWSVWLLYIGKRPPPIALQLAGRAALLVAFALALLLVVATLTTARTGLQALVAPATDAALARQREVEARWVGADSASITAIVARQTTDGRVVLAALSRFPCRASCLIASAGVSPGPAIEALAARAAALPAGRSTALGRPDHRTMVVARAPLRGPDGRTGALLLVGVAATEVIANTQRLAWQLAGATVVLSLAGLIITRAVVARTLSQRVQDLIAHIGEEVTIAPGDELEQLSGRVGQLVRRSVDLETHLQQTQKMEAVGRLTGGIAHDFNNLLTVIRANTALLRTTTDREELDDIDRAAQRGAALVRRLMVFGRQGVLELAPHPIGPLLHELFATLRRLLPDTVRIELPPKIPGGVIDVDRTAFDQVVLNLVTNARDAMPSGGTLTVAVDTATPPADFATANGVDATRTYLTIAIGDSGTGMTPAVAARAFEPFFTTKPPDQGTGLGLAMVYGLMRRHGGAVQLTTAPERGTTQTLWFPYHAVPDPTATPPTGVRAIITSGPRSGHLLVIEDEEMVRRTTELTLKRMGYTVSTAEHGKEGLRLLDGPVPFLAAISDVQMPVMGGLEFVRLARSRGHRIPILLVSGYSLEDVDEVIARHPGVGSLGKPWSAADLARALDRLLDPRP